MQQLQNNLRSNSKIDSNYYRMQLIFEDQWTGFKNTVIEVAEETIGRRRGTQKERWIQDRTWQLIDNRRSQMPKRTGKVRRREGKSCEQIPTIRQSRQTKLSG